MTSEQIDRHDLYPKPFMPSHLARFKVDLPCRRSGRVAIRHYSISKREAENTNWQIIMKNEDRAWSYPGKYTGIEIDGIMYASDEAKEIVDYLPFLQRARGRILLTGLGLGMCLLALLQNDDIEYVTVVENNADVIAVIMPFYRAMLGDERMTIVEADAFAWQPPKGSRYDLAYHDIWPVAAGFYWPQHTALYRHYEAYCAEQDSWRAEWMKKHYELLMNVRHKRDACIQVTP